MNQIHFRKPLEKNPTAILPLGIFLAVGRISLLLALACARIEVLLVCRTTVGMPTDTVSQCFPRPCSGCGEPDLADSRRAEAPIVARHLAERVINVPCSSYMEPLIIFNAVSFVKLK